MKYDNLFSLDNTNKNVSNNSMDSVIEYLRLNLNWIKDLATLVFTGTATVLAILTYRRARATV